MLLAAPPLRWHIDAVARGGRWLAVAGLVAAVGGGAPARAGSNLDAEAADTLRWHIDAGGRTDWTNEQFYEDAFLDTTFLGRRLVSAPEGRVGLVASAALAGTRGRRRGAYALENEIVLGDRLVRGRTSGWYQRNGEVVQLRAGPRLEYERDRTFGVDLERLHAWGEASLRATGSDGANRLRLAGTGELLRTSGRGNEFVPDRDVLRASAAFDRLPWIGPEWGVRYDVANRLFPDSTSRNHVEHAVGATGRVEGWGAQFLTAELAITRRRTLRPAPDSRDRFMLLESSLSWEAPGPAVGAYAGVDLEAMEYDRPDTAVFFDHRIVRGRAGARIERAPWSVAVGPAGEILSAFADRLEQYRELAAKIEFERASARSWWMIGPSLGWREYERPRTKLEAELAHASLRFEQVELYADHRVAADVRLRMLGSARIEHPGDAGGDSRSLYFSMDVRKIF